MERKYEGIVVWKNRCRAGESTGVAIMIPGMLIALVFLCAQTMSPVQLLPASSGALSPSAQLLRSVASYEPASPNGYSGSTLAVLCA